MVVQERGVTVFGFHSLCCLSPGPGRRSRVRVRQAARNQQNPDWRPASGRQASRPSVQGRASPWPIGALPPSHDHPPRGVPSPLPCWTRRLSARTRSRSAFVTPGPESR